MTRNGKIARLPNDVREELNRRLQDGQSGPGLLDWLNKLPECGEMLDDYFDSLPITKQNLSEWKQGGYKDWLRKEELRQQVRMLADKAGVLEEGAGGMAIADHVGTVLSLELMKAMEQLNEIADPKERWRRLQEILRELHHLRREDHRARRLRIAEEQWEIKSERETKEYERREKEAEAERLLRLQGAMKDKIMLSKLKGRGKEASKWVDWELRVHHGLPMPYWWKEPKAAEEWAKLMTPLWEEQVKERREDAGLPPVSRPQSAAGGEAQSKAQEFMAKVKALEEAEAKAGKSKRRGPKPGSAQRPRKVQTRQTKSNPVKGEGESPVSSPQSTVDEDGGISGGVDNGVEDKMSRETENGDRRDACPTSESVQASQTKSESVKPNQGESTVLSSQSTVEEANGIEHKIEDGDKRDACPTAEKSTVEGNGGKAKGLGKKTEDGDRRDACPTAEKSTVEENGANGGVASALPEMGSMGSMGDMATSGEDD